MKRYLIPITIIIVQLVTLSALGEAKMEIERNNSYSTIKKVVLFNTGIGYFERNVMIKNGTPLKLTFKSDEINDVLKSIVFFDVKGGKIERIDYPSKLPLDKMLESFSINILESEKLFSILKQLKGELIEVKTDKVYRGMIVGVEMRQRDDNSVGYLNLFTSEGLVSISFDSIKKIRFLNPEIESQFNQSLKLIAREHNREKKELILHFSGSENGNFRLAYILPTPIWKMSYRLVINEDDKVLLQGWAIIENTTEEDWSNISLTLVSGNPISYIMDLYTPIFVKRPEIEIPLPPEIKPRIYQGTIEEEEEYTEYEIAPSEIHEKRISKAPSRAAQITPEVFTAGKEMDITGGVKQRIMGEVKGDFFSYTIEHPITIPVRKSTMIPVINTTITGKEMVVYNENILEKHPLNGFEIKNTTGMYLSGGPITVFKEGTFAGDAQIETLAPDEKRLITFSVDLDTEIVAERKSLPQLIESVKIVRGVLESKIKLQRSILYRINNRGKKPKNLLIEQNIDPDWKLIKPAKPHELTHTMYRFMQKIPGIESRQHSRRFEVIEEKIIGKKVALLGTDTTEINFYLKSGEISEKVRKALERLVKLKEDLAKMEEDYRAIQDRYVSLSKDQTRIRNNMRNLDKNSNLYKRYVEILEKQEDEIEKILEEKEKLSEAISEKKKEIGEYINSLDIE
mgnify:CR=1 FL=1